MCTATLKVLKLYKTDSCRVISSLMKQECIQVGCAPSESVAVLGGGGVCLAGVCPGDVCLWSLRVSAQWGVCPGGRCLRLVPGGSLPRGGCLPLVPGGCLPLVFGVCLPDTPVNRITERCKNITLRNYEIRHSDIISAKIFLLVLSMTYITQSGVSLWSCT